MTNDEQTILDLLPGPGEPGVLLTAIFRKLRVADVSAAWDTMSELRRRGAVEYYDVPVDGGTRLVYRQTGVAA